MLSVTLYEVSQENEGSIYGKKEMHLPLCSQNRKRKVLLFSPAATDSFPPGMGNCGIGTSGETVKTLPGEIRRVLSSATANKAGRESDRNQCETRVNL